MTINYSVRPNTSSMAALAVLMIAGGSVYAQDVALKLAGDQEVPTVSSSANGAGTISVNKDKSVTGSIKTTGIAGTMAHIHLAGPGKNGPPIISLVKTADNTWSVPANSVLTDEQYARFKKGELYVNVHSDAHQAGEIRAQLKP